MAKNPLSHAVAQRDFHKAQAAKWDQYISLHRELYGLDGEANEAVTFAASPSAFAMSGGNATISVRRSSTPAKTGAIAETREGARLILEDAQGYVQTADLIERLKEMGVEVGGAEPSSTLSARLSGDPEIVSRRGHGYRLKRFAELEGAAGSPQSETPAAPLFPDGADEDGREVEHNNMNH